MWRNAIFAALLLMVTACSGVPSFPVMGEEVYVSHIGPGIGWHEGRMWHLTMRIPATKAQWVIVGTGGLRYYCKTYPGYTTLACSLPRYDGGTCLVYAEQSRTNTPDWLVRHEEWHCAGWDHEYPY